jgi:hypothetical protein
MSRVWMFRGGNLIEVAASLLVAVCLAGLAEAQQCNDFDACTTNDMCRDGECTGTPATGGSCDDFDDCTVNDRCVTDFGEIICRGDPAPAGTECQGGCGTCQALVPLPGVPLTCAPKPSLPQTCRPIGADDLGPCFPGRCMEFGGGGFGIVTCLPQAITCPDTDGNPCTDACNPETGRCERIERPCGYPGCGRCDPNTGNCMPINVGRACDDFNECTVQSRCADNGICVAGVPTPGGQTPTATVVGQNTPTATVAQATPTVPAGTACTCDCNGDRRVAINELVTAVGIGLGTNDLQTCPAADANGDGTVAVNEVIQGVNFGQTACPA